MFGEVRPDHRFRSRVALRVSLDCVRCWNSCQRQSALPDRHRVTPILARLPTHTNKEPLADTTVTESHSRQDTEDERANVVVGVSVEVDLRRVAALRNGECDSSAPGRWPIGRGNANGREAIEEVSRVAGLANTVPRENSEDDQNPCGLHITTISIPHHGSWLAVPRHPDRQPGSRLLFGMGSADPVSSEQSSLTSPCSVCMTCFARSYRGT